MSELIRAAVRERYLLTAEERSRLLEEIFRLELPVRDWSEEEAEVEAAHGDGLS